MTRLNNELRIAVLLPHLAGRLGRTSLVLALVAALSAGVAAQDKNPPAKSEPKADGKDRKPTVARGETVTETSKSIWSVFQDKNNNHWFGSDGQGVYRYDGKTLTQFTTKHGLPDNRIRGIQQHQSGDIFINTTKGISRYDGQTFTAVKIAENHPPGSGWKLQQDDLWFAGAQNSGAVYRYDGISLHQLAFPKTKRGDDHFKKVPRSAFLYTPYDVYTIYKDRRGSLWFGTADLGAVRYDGKTFDWLYEDRLTNVPNGGSFGIRSIVEDKEGKFWICNTRHRYNIIPNSPTGNGLMDYKQEKGLGDLKAQVGEDSFYFAAAIIDKQGGLWMTTYNEGVWRLDGKTLTRYPVNADVKKIWIQSIYQDNRGVLWLGTNDAGAFKFNGKTFEQFKPSGQDKNPDAKPAEKPTVAKGEIVSDMPKALFRVFQAKDGRHLFLSGSEGAFRYDGKTIARFTKKDGLAGEGVGGVQEDKSGNLYFSTNGGISLGATGGLSASDVDERS